MQELKVMLNDLKAYLQSKREEIDNRLSSNSYTQSALANREADIKRFELGIDSVTTDFTLKNTIVNNFRKESDAIKARIDEIEA